jgi:exonuclease III
VALCEVWLDSIDIKNLNIRNYSLAASFGRKKGNRGGVAFLVNKKCGFKSKVVKSDSFEMSFETCSIDLFIENRVIQLILIYRPSNTLNNTQNQIQSFFCHLENLLANTIAHDKEVILLGDLNVDLLKSNDNSAQLINVMTAYQFSLLNSMKPTRSFNGSSSSSSSFISLSLCIFTCLTFEICRSEKLYINNKHKSLA